MLPAPLMLSPSYLAMVRGTRELHRLSAVGKDDSPEADAIRDATDGPWETLSDTERQRVRNLSEDLYSLSEIPPELKPLNPHAQGKLYNVFEARRRGDWDRALELLRRWRAYVDPAMLSYLRGTIWLEAGDPNTAVVFYEHSSSLQPEDATYLVILLHTLELVDPIEAQQRSNKILSDPDKFEPVVISRAVNIVFKTIRNLSEADASQLLSRLIPILKDSLSRIKQGDESGVDRSSYAMTIALLGFSYEFLGEMQTALEYYSDGLKTDPNNDGLLVARGILLYGTSPRAESDFEAAIQQGSPLIWPFFFLAHHFLVNNRFQECFRFCERALQMPGSNSVKSELWEWSAISQAELGFPVEITRQTFETAIRLDPGSDRAKFNLAQFDAAIQPMAKRSWKTRTPGSVRTSGLTERRYSLAA